MTALEILNRFFGYQQFRPLQAEIIQSCLDGHDVLALLPTGGGKSLCFQVPGIALNGLTIVISPLISLMKDQVDRLVSKGIAATYINSSQDDQLQESLLQQLKNQAFTFIYVSPEKLQSKRFLAAVSCIPISLIVIDEAHCISEWGHDFRPAYRQISQFIDHLPIRPRLMALTATATAIVQHDILAQLKLNKPTVFAQSFKRQNLHLHVLKCYQNQDKDLWLLRILQQHEKDTGIIYVATRKMAEALTKKLNAWQFRLGFKTGAYHGGLSAVEKSQIQEHFLANQLSVIIATNAFGMGIDKSDVRFVIHYHLPASLEHYFQEAGRAGRDRQISHCYVLFNEVDMQIHATFIRKSLDLQRQHCNYAKLHHMAQFLRTSECRTRYLLTYFDEHDLPETCELCDNCLPASNYMNDEQCEQFRLQLLKWLTANCQRFTFDPQQILHPHTLEYVVFLRPRTLSELAVIPGIGLGWLKSWGASYVSYFRSQI